MAEHKLAGNLSKEEENQKEATKIPAIPIPRITNKTVHD